MSETPEPEAVVDPVTAIQNTLSDMASGAMCIGYVCAVEWLEADGSSSIEIIHTDMPPWHMRGLLDWAQEMGTTFIVSGDSLIDDDDDF